MGELRRSPKHFASKLLLGLGLVLLALAGLWLVVDNPFAGAVAVGLIPIALALLLAPIVWPRGGDDEPRDPPILKLRA